MNRAEHCRKLFRRHGLSRTPVHKAWVAMNNRTRGGIRFYEHVTVCERWKVFENFLADMGHPPPGYTLDRKDSRLGYSPDNCRWATPVEQARNMKSNRIIELLGQRKTLAEWSEITGIKPMTIAKRLNAGLPPELAILIKQFKYGEVARLVKWRAK